jgi:predicted MFS family arabinose efflux permease
LINSLASVLGPTIAAGIMDVYGARSLFFFTAAIHTAMAAFTIVRLRVKQAAGAEHREKFEPLPHEGSPSSLELDPRRTDESIAA